MHELVLSAAKIGVSLGVLCGALYGVAVWARAARLAPELSRKLIHVGLGLYCLTLPFLFTHSWEVALTCALAIAVFALARGPLRARFGGGLHAVARHSYGEIYFAAAVALLFALRHQGMVFYLLPIAMLTICDAAAALVGVRYGRVRFVVADGTKSGEGVAAFVATAWLVAYVALITLTPLSAGDAMLVSAAIALVGAAIEAVSGRGLDNLFIPLGAYSALATMVSDTGADRLLACLLCAGAALVLIHLMRGGGVRIAGAT